MEGGVSLETGLSAQLFAEEESIRDPEHAPALLQGEEERNVKETALRPGNATQKSVR